MEQKTKIKNTPKLFIILRIIAGLLIAGGITLIVLGATKQVPNMGDPGWFDAEAAKGDLIFGGVACLIFGVVILFAGFMPLIHKSMSKVVIHTTNQILEENKQELKDMADTKAEISADALKTTARAVKQGLTDTVYCKDCGKEIDKDSKFCRYCGKPQ